MVLIVAFLKIAPKRRCILNFSLKRNQIKLKFLMSIVLKRKVLCIAKVHNDGGDIVLNRNESTDISPGHKHCLENIGSYN